MTSPSPQAGLQEWIDWLLALHAEEIDLGLERVALVAEKMTISRPAPFVITVAGTNGKGSSVAMLNAILQAADYQVGCYTSPHILRFNERIQINGQEVSDKAIVEAFYAIEQARGETKLTYFEFSTLAALYLFKQAKVDVAVLEVGLGGRLDAVNLVDADAALITAIGVDHIDWLGSDRGQIAIEKAGITRSGRPAVCSDPLPPETLAEFTKQHAVPLRQLQNEFSYEVHSDAWLFKDLESNHVARLPLPALQGEFQIQNAAGVVALLNTVSESLPVPEEAVNNGLKSVKHPGRLQWVNTPKQAWLVDVAHNPQSAEVLADYLKTQNKKFVAVFSVLDDKDSVPMISEIAPFVSDWFIADLDIPRATGLSKLNEHLLQAGVESNAVVSCESIEQAVQQASQRNDSDVLVWGSFFTVSQAFQALEQQGLVLGFEASHG